MSKIITNLVKMVIAAALMVAGTLSTVVPHAAQAAGPVAGQPVSDPQALPASGVLNAAEAESLLFMVEEEKLARDVYLALYQKWELPVFQNISNSEQAHMNAISRLITRYGLTNPVQSAPGKFTDPALQSLYTQLVARGSGSIGEALKVGGLIEEIDILDLQTRLGETSRTDIQQVYNNLMNGSYNHLRAFSATLKTQTGETYQPQKLSLADYQAIVSSSDRGRPGRRNGRGRQGGA